MTHDGVGNRLEVTSNLPSVPGYSGLTEYQYNSKDELTQESSARFGTYVNSFSYDTAGNPTNFKGASRSYNANNQLTTGSFVYDGNGNPTTYAGTAMTYDPENRLTSVGTVMTAGYRADGLRAWKETSSGRIYFLYDGYDLVCELDSLGTWCPTPGARTAWCLATRTRIWCSTPSTSGARPRSGWTRTSRF